MKTFAVTLALTAVLAGACRAQNIYPDPGFEATGEAGPAHTGARAGHLAIGARSHWGALGGALQVQPFARYRVTEWVRARVGGGTFYGPYCYAWDSYEWAFQSTRPLATGDAWTRVETTFVAPTSTMYVHPLAYLDGENGEAWVDDVVVQKVAEPAAVMRELAAKATPTEDDQRLLARWAIAHGNPAAAAAAMRAAQGEARADMATVIAASIRNVRARRPYVVEVAAYGGPTYNDGLKRWREITAGMTPAQSLDACLEGARRNPGLDRAGRSVALVVGEALSGPGGPMTVSSAVRAAELVMAPLRAALAGLPSGSPAAKEVQVAMEAAEQSRRAAEARRQELGHCVVRIGGKPILPGTHAIVVPDTPTPQEQYAARELQCHLELVTGAALPIVREGQRGQAIPLYVGKCRAAGHRALHLETGDLGLEGLRVRTDGPAIAFAGNRRGVLYAVYDFLENDLGCRWFTPDCSTWPRTGTIDVARIDRKHVPELEYRAGDFPVARPGDFAARCRLNGSNHGQTDEQGGKVGVHSLAHTFAALVPPDKHFAAHPEYFSLVGGKRQSGYAQLCLTNPEVLRIAIEGVRKWIRDNPNMTVFSVSQNDTANYCECDKCTAIAKEEGSQAGPMLRFVNAVADAIGKDHPNIAIETLAYQYTRKPPRITKPRPNVIVCLCSIECCFIHPLGDDPFNKSFVDDIVGWSQICKRLWIWDYIINYAHSVSPFPNLNVLAPNVRFFLAHGVKGIYEESCYYTKGSELQELRNYLMAKALWDPNYDTAKGIREFCDAYYGAAGPAVRRYVDLIHSATQRDPNLHVQIYTHPRQYLTPAILAEARGIFDEAEATVKDNALLLHRVEVARLPIIYAEIAMATGGAFVERGDRLVQEGGTDISALAARFERIARAEGLTMVREGGGDATLDAWLQSLPRQAHEIKVEQLRGRALAVDVLPEAGGRIWRIRTLAPEQDVLLVKGSPTGRTPTEGGYEEYSEGAYKSLGWNEPYAVTARGERSITLQADLRNGLRLTRMVEVDADRPLVTITSTLSNPAGPARKACLRVHPEFTLASTAEAVAGVRDAAGTWHDTPLANPADPAAEKDLWLRGGDAPHGAWRVVDHAGGLTITNSLLGGTVGQCLLNWSGAQRRVNLEVYSPEVTLEPGQSITLKHSYEVARTGK